MNWSHSIWRGGDENREEGRGDRDKTQGRKQVLDASLLMSVYLFVKEKHLGAPLLSRTFVPLNNPRKM